MQVGGELQVVLVVDELRLGAEDTGRDVERSGEEVEAGVLDEEVPELGAALEVALADAAFEITCQREVVEGELAVGGQQRGQLERFAFGLRREEVVGCHATLRFHVAQGRLRLQMPLHHVVAETFFPFACEGDLAQTADHFSGFYGDDGLRLSIAERLENRLIEGFVHLQVVERELQLIKRVGTAVGGGQQSMPLQLEVEALSVQREFLQAKPPCLLVRL